MTPDKTSDEMFNEAEFLRNVKENIDHDCYRMPEFIAIKRLLQMIRERTDRAYRWMKLEEQASDKAEELEAENTALKERP